MHTSIIRLRAHLHIYNDKFWQISRDFIPTSKTRRDKRGLGERRLYQPPDLTAVRGGSMTSTVTDGLRSKPGHFTSSRFTQLVEACQVERRHEVFVVVVWTSTSPGQWSADERTTS